MSIDLTIEDHVARITINRPDILNAIDTESERLLQRAWETIEADDTVRAVILTGAGDRAFCVGADMKHEDGSSAIEYWAASRPGGFGGIALRTSLDVPVIARVNGYALGGGMEMVLGCDIVIAADHAEFGLPEPRVGRIPLDGGVSTLVRRIPHVWAMELLLTGRRISAAEAARIGIVNQVAPAGDLDVVVDALIGQVLACAPLSLRAIKQIVQRTGHMTSEEAQATRLPGVMRALLSDDAREGVNAFRDRRKPRWSGS